VALLVAALSCTPPREGGRAASCALPARAHPEAELSAGPLAAPTGTSILYDEAVRELGAARSSAYQHSTEVDEQAGRFDFDCSGFLTYAVQAVAPDARAALPNGPKGRPRAEELVSYFEALPIEGQASAGSRWVRVARVEDARPGDVVAWRRPADVDNTNTGHVAIVAARPSPLDAAAPVAAVGGVREWLVRVIDSTLSPHASDTRGDEESGLGCGTIGLVEGQDGAVVGYRWRGGLSARAHRTTIVIARLRNVD
jgi:hypothetical protein